MWSSIQPSYDQGHKDLQFIFEKEHYIQVCQITPPYTYPPNCRQRSRLKTRFQIKV